tara:strand:+ start:2495 stop:2791 length:297 start_codon:yes stop_codon:yes gene_type:complete
MSLTSTEAQVLSTLVVIAICVLMAWIVRRTKSKSHNTHVWGTVFESLTHYVQPQTPLKAPQQEIRKQKRLAGDDEHRAEQKAGRNKKAKDKTKDIGQD